MAKARNARDLKGEKARIKTRKNKATTDPPIKCAFRKKAAVSSNLRPFGSWIYSRSFEVRRTFGSLTILLNTRRLKWKIPKFAGPRGAIKITRRKDTNLSKTAPITPQNAPLKIVVSVNIFFKKTGKNPEK